MKKKAIHIRINQPLADIITKSLEAGAKFHDDGNADIVIKGDITLASADIAKIKMKLVADLNTQLAAAVLDQNKAEVKLVEDFNLGVDKANEVYPNNEIKLTELALTLSGGHTDLPAPTIVDGCSAVKSVHSGFATMHWHRQEGVRSFLVMETTDLTDLMDESTYYPADPVMFLTSKAGEVKPKDSGKITWWRVYGENATGKGVWSAPFGGFKIS